MTCLWLLISISYLCTSVSAGIDDIDLSKRGYFRDEDTMEFESEKELRLHFIREALDKEDDNEPLEPKLDKDARTALILFHETSEPLDVAIISAVLHMSNYTVRRASMTEFPDRVKMANDMVFVADCGLPFIREYAPFDVIVIAGTQKYANISANPLVAEMLKLQEANDKYIVAVGYGIMVLYDNRLAYGKEVACPPELVHKLNRFFSVMDTKDYVDTAGLMTSRQSGDLLEFAVRVADLYAKMGVVKKVKKELGFRHLKTERVYK